MADIETNNGVTLLTNWLSRQISPESFAWLKERKAEIIRDGAERKLFTAFSAVPRYIEKTNFQLTNAELATANNLKAGWNPSRWTLDQVGRTILILSFPNRDEDKYIKTLDKIFAAADVGEAIALYQSLPLLPYPNSFKLRAAEGIRTNMTSVFNAVALHNPYPANYLDDLAWNQMILKALFVGTPLHPIYGLKQRNNQQLSQMLLNYARERLAAKRTVNPELWDLTAAFQPEEVVRLKAAFDKMHD
ncbi:EboA family metabolite traffic protein [Myxosarcina sp. GI1]|uniref:EboA family metabolite traffic protein n=1 Tax=Myxosarcina sp. GI1 TaxID=1541065 RepID=UPI00055A5876|nr:EboA family metabolite traffic protein [Myxosarcina sp. GI1]